MITMMNALLLATALATAPAAPAATPPPAAVEPAAEILQQSVDDLALATVNAEPVLARDVVALFNKRHAGHAKFLGGEVEARRFLYLVIDDRLLVQEAYDLGIDELPEVKGYVEEFVRSEIAKYFVANQVTETIKVAPEEVKAVWDSNFNQYIHARHVVLATRTEAEQVRAALLAGNDLDTLARTCSLSDSRRRGGNLMVGWGLFPESWERVVFGLQEGEISPVIESGGFFEVVQISQKVEAQRPPFDQVAKKIEDALFRRKLEARRDEVSLRLATKYNAKLLVTEYSPALLQRFLETAPDTVVATYDGGTLTLKDVFERAEIEPLLRADPVQARIAIADELRQTLNAPLVALEARAMKMDEVPTVATEIARYRDYVVESVLFRDHIFRDLKLETADLQKYFDANAKEFELPERRRLAQILVPTEVEAKKVRKEAVAPAADFGALAKKYSRDMVSSANGGDLGWVAPDSVPDDFKEVLTAKPGTILKGVKTPSGWHIIKVLEIAPKAMPKLADVEEKVRERALEAKKKELRMFWLEKLRNANEIRIDDKAIAAFVKANESTAPPPQHGMQ